MTPPPSSAASFCDAAAILPSLYLATTRVLPRPAVASRFVDAPDAAPPPVSAAPPRPAIVPAVAPDAAPPRPAVARLSCCCQAIAVVLPGHRGLLLSRPIASVVAPRLALLSRQKLCCKTSSVLVLPCPAWPLPCSLPSPLPSSRYRPSPAVIPLSPCCHLLGGHPAAIARPPRPAIKCRRALLPCCCGSALLLLTYLAASTHIPSSPVHLHGC